MTFNQFKYLSEDEQENLLWKKGVELGRVSDDFYHYILYQVDGFYMEIKYTLPQRNIIEIACFDDTGMLDPYIKNINVSSLFAA